MNNMSKENMVVLRQSAGEDLIHIGAGFIDVVNTKKYGQRPRIRLLPNDAARLEKGQQILVFAGKEMQDLPENITQYGDIDSKKPQYVLFDGKVPVGSGWLNQRNKVYLKLVLNKPLSGGKLAVFPHAPSDAAE